MNARRIFLASWSSHLNTLPFFYDSEFSYFSFFSFTRTHKTNQTTNFVITTTNRKKREQNRSKYFRQEYRILFLLFAADGESNFLLWTSRPLENHSQMSIYILFFGTAFWSFETWKRLCVIRSKWPKFVRSLAVSCVDAMPVLTELDKLKTVWPEKIVRIFTAHTLSHTLSFSSNRSRSVGSYFRIRSHAKPTDFHWFSLFFFTEIAWSCSGTNTRLMQMWFASFRINLVSGGIVCFCKQRKYTFDDHRKTTISNWTISEANGSLIFLCRFFSLLCDRCVYVRRVFEVFDFFNERYFFPPLFWFLFMNVHAKSESSFVSVLNRTKSALCQLHFVLNLILNVAFRTDLHLSRRTIIHIEAYTNRRMVMRETKRTRAKFINLPQLLVYCMMTMTATKCLNRQMTENEWRLHACHAQFSRRFHRWHAFLSDLMRYSDWIDGETASNHTRNQHKFNQATTIGSAIV